MIPVIPVEAMEKYPQPTIESAKCGEKCNGAPMEACPGGQAFLNWASSKPDMEAQNDRVSHQPLRGTSTHCLPPILVRAHLKYEAHHSM